MVWVVDCRPYASGWNPTHANVNFFLFKMLETYTLTAFVQQKLNLCVEIETQKFHERERAA